MCLICIEYQKGKLTHFEASRNLSEFEEVLDEEHYIEVALMLWEEERKQYMDDTED